MKKIVYIFSGLMCITGGAAYADTCPDLNTIIGTTAGSNMITLSNTGNSSTGNLAAYNITENGTFAVDYGSGLGVIRGRAQCSSQSGTNNNNTWTDPTISATLPDNSGGYCYCQLDGYTPDGGSTIALSTPWVFRSGNSNSQEDSNFCINNCTSHCANRLQQTGGYSLNFRSVVFGAATCPVLEYDVASTSYVQGAHEALNSAKMANAVAGTIEWTQGSTSNGIITSVVGAGDKFQVSRTDVTIPVGSPSSPTGRMGMWLE